MMNCALTYLISSHLWFWWNDHNFKAATPWLDTEIKQGDKLGEGERAKVNYETAQELKVCTRGSSLQIYSDIGALHINPRQNG